MERVKADLRGVGEERELDGLSCISAEQLRMGSLTLAARAASFSAYDLWKFPMT